MAFYSILEVSPTNEDWIADYTGTASALVAQHGGSISLVLRAQAVAREMSERLLRFS